MAVIEPIKQRIHPLRQLKKYSAALRFWHWANAIIICGSLLTILINSTVLDGNSNVALIKTALHKTSTNITSDQAKSIVHLLRDKVWTIHVYFGFSLASLLLFRFILEFFQKADQKFTRILKSAYAHFKTTKNSREPARHELAVRTIYALFYMLLILIVTTGLILAFDDELTALKPYRHKIQNIHGLCMYLVLVFIAVHVVGVFLAERKDGKGIVSDMINGGKR